MADTLVLVGEENQTAGLVYQKRKKRKYNNRTIRPSQFTKESGGVFFRRPLCEIQKRFPTL